MGRSVLMASYQRKTYTLEMLVFRDCADYLTYRFTFTLVTVGNGCSSNFAKI